MKIFTSISYVYYLSGEINNVVSEFISDSYYYFMMYKTIVVGMSFQRGF